MFEPNSATSNTHKYPQRVVLPHFRERVDESPWQDENFGTFGLFLSFFVSELRPLKVKDKFFQCIFEALFINSANALLLTAVSVALTRIKRKQLVLKLEHVCWSHVMYFNEVKRIKCLQKQQRGLTFGDFWVTASCLRGAPTAQGWAAAWWDALDESPVISNNPH